MGTADHGRSQASVRRRAQRRVVAAMVARDREQWRSYHRRQTESGGGRRRCRLASREETCGSGHCSRRRDELAGAEVRSSSVRHRVVADAATAEVWAGSESAVSRVAEARWCRWASALGSS
ncbi:hypothetical protein EUGRSUZ_J00822 [Eucalyptus grandis]|uniref:Uncharacterized protein n=2 Tax=Eucalyptus grandis TaxID=71139 RepID=A0ACC3J4N0_EUCGR|nr:hypothetical protein EUGRSUZ_J00822 [Eucalyptus grandis]